MLRLRDDLINTQTASLGTTSRLLRNSKRKSSNSRNIIVCNGINVNITQTETRLEVQKRTTDATDNIADSIASA